MNNTLIRRITAEDKTELLQIMIDFYNSPALLHHTPKDILSHVIDDCTSDLPFIEGFALIIDGKISGYTMVSLGYSTEYGGMRIFIEDLYVVPNMRGKKFGKMLLDYVAEYYKSAAVQLRLEVAPDNEHAIKVYRKCGYSDIEYKQMGKKLN